MYISPCSWPIFTLQKVISQFFTLVERDMKTMHIIFGTVTIPFPHIMIIITGFTSVVLSTIERRYRFSSTAAGLIASTFDMAVLVSVLFISYFGGKGHKPRWLGISLIIQGAGGSLSNTHTNTHTTWNLLCAMYLREHWLITCYYMLLSEVKDVESIAFCKMQ